MNQKIGKIIIIVAPSGSGKSTLIKMLKVDFPNLLESVSYTTRPKREGEVDGVHYFFIDKETFLEMKEKGDFIEWAEVHKNFYGTSKTFVNKKINKGYDMLFDLDVQGTDSFKNHFKDKAKAIFISPPSIEELEKRLRGRATDSKEVINVRINNAKNELKRNRDYDYQVINDDLDGAFSKLKIIFNEILEGSIV